MRIIAEQNLLLRAQVTLPAGIRPDTEDFRDGWNFVAVPQAPLLKKKIVKLGWSFTPAVDGWLRSGVGATSQLAIAGALSLALTDASPLVNAIQITRIEWTEYPWFYLARVTVNPYCIQQSALLPIPDSDAPLPLAHQPKLLPSDDAALFPNFACNIPVLREVLVLSRSSQALFNPPPAIQ